MGWTRFVPRIEYHHVIMIILAIPVVLFSVLLAGCTSASSSMVDVYLLSLSYQRSPIVNNSTPSNDGLAGLLRSTAGHASLEVRTGYFMLCISQNVIDDGWNCDSNVAALVRNLGSSGDPLNLVGYSSKFRTEVVFYGLIIATIPLTVVAILLLWTFPGWHTSIDDDGSEQEVKPFPSMSTINVILGFVSFALLLSFVSALWQHTATAAVATSIEAILHGAVISHVGAAPMALCWVSVGILMLGFLAILVMKLSVELLDRLTDDEEE